MSVIYLPFAKLSLEAVKVEFAWSPQEPVGSDRVTSKNSRLENSES